MGRIPAYIADVGRTDTLSAGAKKALGRMIDTYSDVQKATQVFLDKAEEQGTGNTLRQKVNSVYKKGARLE